MGHFAIRTLSILLALKLTLFFFFSFAFFKKKITKINESLVLRKHASFGHCNSCMWIALECARMLSKQRRINVHLSLQVFRVSWVGRLSSQFALMWKWFIFIFLEAKTTVLQIFISLFVYARKANAKPFLGLSIVNV